MCDIIGKSKEEAIKYLRDNKIRSLIVKEDNISYARILNCVRGRRHLTIEKGIVTGVIIE